MKQPKPKAVAAGKKAAPKARVKSGDGEPALSAAGTAPVKQSPKRNGFHIVAIGASAGGLKAFEQFFLNMPSDSGMAFVLVPHLDPTHKSLLGELLGRYTKMKILEVTDGMKVLPDHVYIIPPNRDMSVLHGTLQLFEPVEHRGTRHPVDLFFRSLAEDRGEKSVCIIFSGTGSEGALGLRAVKGEGGLVIAQDPKTAEYDGMPSSAIATGLVDQILPPEKMPEYLLGYVKRIYPGPVRIARPEDRFADNLQKIFGLIRSRTGHDFSLYKQNTIIRRIEKRMAVHQIERIQDYVTYLRSNPHEADSLFKELLIRVTNFFRDPEAFEILKQEILPQMLKDRSSDLPLRIWAPGCSTGEEAYSLAMVLLETMHDTGKHFDLQVFATDIDSSAIEIARAGIYPENINADVSPERLQKFFVRKGAGYKIRKELRDLMVFAVHNLIKDPPFLKLDMLCCRNVLIYMGTDLQKKIMPLFRYALNQDGILFLGPSETIGDFSDMFSVADKKWKIYRARRTTAALPAPLDLRFYGLREKALKAETAPEIKIPSETGVGEFTEKLLLENYSPPCVVVNEKGNILYINGKTGKYLEPSPGKANLNILEMAREGLRLELMTSFRKAVSGKKDVRTEGVQVKTNGSFQGLDLEIKYIRKPEHFAGLLMVIFHKAPAAKPEKTAKEKARLPEKIKRHITDLEYELKSSKENLQSVIEELETSNEELKSANEELQSSNEELQSTNEELGTSREELQSVNEELITVNSELEGKIEELSRANNDMLNLLASTQIATIFLDRELRIRNFTPSVKGLINIIQTDIGRPVSDFAPKLEYPGLEDDAKEVIRDLVPKEKTVKHKNGRWYLTRIIPYRTTENTKEGVVITFVDITEQKKAQDELRDTLVYEGVVQTVREPLLVLDKDLSVIKANSSFYRMFKESPGATENKLIYELGNNQWDIPALRRLLEKILPENSTFEDFEVEHDFPNIGRRKMLLNARMIYQKELETATILLAIEDVT